MSTGRIVAASAAESQVSVYAAGGGEAARLAVLARTRLLDSPVEEPYDRIARLAARVLAAPIATVTLIDHDRQFYKACVGLPGPLRSERETPLEYSFCKHTVELGEPLVIEDTRLDARVARDQADTANRAKSEFLAMMSHDLRAPLNAIGGYRHLLELGVHGPLTDAERETLSRIKRAQDHLLQLISGVLTFARLEGKASPPELASVPVQETLREIESLVQPQLEGSGLTFAASAGDAAEYMYVDVERLTRIVVNLLTNAAKFTPRGGRVSLAWQIESSGGHPRGGYGDRHPRRAARGDLRAVRADRRSAGHEPRGGGARPGDQPPTRSLHARRALGDEHARPGHDLRGDGAPRPVGRAGRSDAASLGARADIRAMRAETRATWRVQRHRIIRASTRPTVRLPSRS